MLRNYNAEEIEIDAPDRDMGGSAGYGSGQRRGEAKHYKFFRRSSLSYCRVY
jgi:hypothetical protein